MLSGRSQRLPPDPCRGMLEPLAAEVTYDGPELLLTTTPQDAQDVATMPSVR
jgi:hypothetical protein